jgi:hypothetical protein
MRHMSPKRFSDTMRRTPKGVAMLAAIFLLPAASAQAGEIITRDCLHGSEESHRAGYGTTYGEEYGSGYGDRSGTTYSYTQPDRVWSRGAFRFHRGIRGVVSTTTDPNGGGTVGSADAGTSSGYRSGSSTGYEVGSRSGYGSDNCVEIRRELTNPYVLHVPPPQNERDVADLAARERLWQARCKPIIRQDVNGVRRYQYAAPGCDYGKYE